MSSRCAPIHVARIKRTHNGKTYVSVLLRRTYREGGKVRNETVASLSALPAETIEAIERSLKGEKLVTLDSVFECIRSLPHGHVVAILGTLRKLQLENILGSRKSRKRDLVTAMIVARIFEPRSKLATARALSEETAESSLGEMLGVTSATENELYAALDWLQDRQKRIEGKLAKRHLTSSTLLLYDVTITYFEGQACPLAKRTSRRGAMKGKLHILIGLLCDSEGRPIAVEVFEGNKGDPTTLASQVEKIIRRFKIQRVVLVGDRGMITAARIEKDLKPIDGLSWITALRAPTIRKLVAQGDVSHSLFDEENLAEITSDDFPGERLIVCRNPLLADRRARTRKDLLRASERELDKIVKATQRSKSPLKGKDKIGLRVGKEGNRYKVAKHFTFDIGDENFRYHRNEVSISEEAALDGIYVIRTNVPRAELDAPGTVHAYKSLSKVEQAFRCMKTVDLHVRPIYHRLEKRVRGHALLCMLAYYVEWHMRKALRPILFEEDDPIAKEQQRTSPVEPARLSESAKKKARTKKTADGEPVHSFGTLINDLRTVVRNTMRRANNSETGDATFTIVTTPTPLQKRALQLLEVPVPT